MVYKQNFKYFKTEKNNFIEVILKLEYLIKWVKKFDYLDYQ